MDAAHVDRPMQDLAQGTGRRDAVRALGASGLALLAALGLADASAKGSGKGDQDRVQAAGKGKKKRKKKRGSASPAGFTFATRRVISANSDPLPVKAGSFVGVRAECGGEGKVISCGYQTGVDDEPLVNVVVQGVFADADRSFCFASLLRTAEAGSTAGARIQAIAICLE